MKATTNLRIQIIRWLRCILIIDGEIEALFDQNRELHARIRNLEYTVEAMGREQNTEVPINHPTFPWFER